MNPSWARIKDIFGAAVEMAASARGAYVRAQCGGDAAMLAAVESLLQSDAAAPTSFAHVKTVDAAPIGMSGIFDSEIAPSTPGRVGPYEIVRTLGEGGMGVVYEGRHMATGDQAAVKAIRTGKESLVAGFRREARSLARLRHPGIVEVVGDGTTEGRPWYAMTLVSAPTLRSLVAESNLSRVDAFTVVRRICDALAVIHGEGIVHRDIKPDNILVRAGARPILVDFGIASGFAGASGRESFDIDATPTGTVTYMSPEQIRGEFLDARADLYAVGCILYVVLTGRAPFVAKDVRDVVAMHLNEKPKPPSSRVPDVPPDLDDLVLRLLAKQPRDRIGHASVVSSMLEAHGALAWENSDNVVPRSYLYRPTLAGRSAERKRIEELIGRLERGKSANLFMSGESGVGKTRLMLELVRRSRARKLLVLTGECQPPDVARPYELLRRPLQTVADVCRVRRGRPLRAALADHLGALATLEPAFGTFDGTSGSCAAPLSEDSIRRGIVEAFRALAVDRPFVLALDDVQWADEPTRAVLRELVDDASRGPIAIVGAFRSDEAPADMLRLLSKTGVEHLRLDTIAPEALAKVVEDVLGSSPAPKELQQFIGDRSDGNPFFAVEYLRDAVARGALRRDASGNWRMRDDLDVHSLSSDDQPPSILEITTARLRQLPRSARRLAAAAAVLGRQHRTDVAGVVAHLSGDELLLARQELVRTHVLRDAPSSEYRFVHDSMREAAIRALPPARVALLHRRAARALEVAYGGALDDVAQSIALHWERSGDAATAQAWYVRAADCARDSQQAALAESLYRSALRVEIVDTPFGVDALTGLGTLQRQVGAVDESRKTLARAVESARACGDSSREAASLIALAGVYKDLARFDDAMASLDRALTVAQLGGDIHAEARAQRGIAVILVERGDLAQADEPFRVAIAAARAVGDTRLIAQAVGDYGLYRARLGDREGCRPFLEEAARMSAADCDRSQEAFALTNLAAVAVEDKKFDQALDPARRALELASRFGPRRLEASAMAQVAWIQFHLGDVGEARELVERAVPLLDATSSSQDAAIARIYWSVMDRLTGNDVDALRHLRAAHRAARGSSNAFLAAVVWCQLGHLQLARGRSARGPLDRARRLAAEVGVGEGSDVAVAIRTLEDAMVSDDRIRGESRSSIPAGLLELLDEDVW